MLTDYFIASPGELEKLRVQTGPCDVLRSVRAKGVDTVKLGSLQRILGAMVDDPILGELKCSVMGKPRPEGPWLFAVPSAVTDTLARLTEPAITQVAARWAQAPEWRADRGTGVALTAVLKQLCALAERARSQDREVFLWMSL